VKADNVGLPETKELYHEESASMLVILRKLRFIPTGLGLEVDHSKNEFCWINE